MISRCVFLPGWTVWLLGSAWGLRLHTDLQMQRNKAPSPGGSFLHRSELASVPKSHNTFISEIWIYLTFIISFRINSNGHVYKGVWGIHSFVVACLNHYCETVKTDLTCLVVTVCVWPVLKGGPGIRGARGDRGESGVTVSKTHRPFITHIIYLFLNKTLSTYLVRNSVQLTTREGWEPR